MDPKFYENDIEPTVVEEIEFIRSPFYDLAKDYHMNENRADEVIDMVTIKGTLMDRMQGITSRAQPSKEEKAYTRYADNLSNAKDEHLFKFPRGEPYRRINNAELFRV